jgi:hypothetical protein
MSIFSNPVIYLLKSEYTCSEVVRMDERLKRIELELKLLLNKKAYEQGLIEHELFTKAGENLLKEYGAQGEGQNYGHL